MPDAMLKPQRPQRTGRPRNRPAARTALSQAILRMVEASGETDDEICKRAGVGRNAIGRIRSGETYRPKPHVADRLLLALGISATAERDAIRRSANPRLPVFTIQRSPSP